MRSESQRGRRRSGALMLATVVALILALALACTALARTGSVTVDLPHQFVGP